MALGLLGGCASLPQPVGNVLGTVPFVSLLIDGAQIEDMARRFEDGSISEAEARAIASRALPSPPGISHDIAALRRAMAALTAGDLEATGAAAQLVVSHGVSEELKIIALGMVSEVEQARGRLQSALRYAAEAERRWTALAELARAKGQPVPKYEFGRHIGVARVAGQFREAERLLVAYDAWRTRFRKTNFLADLMSDAEFASQRSEYLSTIGNFDAAYSTAHAALQRYREGLSTMKEPSGLEGMLARARHESLLRLLVRTSVQQGQFAKAVRHVDDLRVAVAAHGNRRSSVAGLNDVTALLLAYGGDHAAATLKIDEAWRAQPAAVRNARLAVFQMSSFKAMVLALGGDLPGAHAVLTQVRAATAAEDSLLGDVWQASLVQVSALLGRFDPPPESLERMDRRYLGHVASDHALLHFGAKVVAYERRGAMRGSPADHVSAVRNGRAFSRGLRAMQLSGELRSLPLMDRYLAVVKESYLASASAALGRDGVDTADLMDALSLLQRTETDDDIAAAATRQRSVPGVSATQLRELQDLRQAARTAQRQLMAYGRSVEADTRQAAELARSALDAQDKLLAFVRSLQQAAPRLYSALAPDALSVSQIQERLGAQEALVSVSTLKQGTHVLIVTREGFHQRLVRLPRDEARALVERIRESVAFDENTEPALEFDTTAAHVLHERLFDWAAEPMRQVRQISVVATNELAAIPFSLLVRSPPAADGTAGASRPAWLIRTMAVSHMPSIASWRAVAGKALGDNTASFVAWADPAFKGIRAPANVADAPAVRRALRPLKRGSAIESTRLPANLGDMLLRLADTRQEAEAVARAFGAPRDAVIAGEQATRSSVLAMSRSGQLRRKSVLMFATHGLAPFQVPGLTQPALALAQEPGEALPSLLDLEDVIGLDLNADWVLLSACNTSSADRAGGDPLSGLVRGFFYAGASSLLVTHWEVESKSAAAITTMTIEHLRRDRRLNRAQALQRTAIDMIESRNTPARWAHPAYWAPYALVGSAAR